VAALAAERSRLARGRWPKAPADLAPDFLAGAPVDPFDGGPLRLARHGEGIVLYAVDADGKDNGGEPERLNTFRPKGDIGLRLWDAARRKGPK
jgi:hypothetical protein